MRHGLRARQVCAWLILAAIVLASSPSILARPADQPPGLFSDSGRQRDASLPLDPAVVRARYVEVNFGLLGGSKPTPGSPLAPADSVNLNLSRRRAASGRAWRSRWPAPASRQRAPAAGSSGWAACRGSRPAR